jgi:C-terminal processing protease CtpA/Prc
LSEPQLKIDASIRSEVINNLSRELDESYIFAETAQKIKTDLFDRLKNGEYDSITDAKAFAMKLTADLQLISKDKHLHVDYFAKSLQITAKRKDPTQEEKAKRLLFDKHFNFGFKKVARMDGNIGYIDLRGFKDSESGKETVAAAMTLISNTDALIIDLRYNGGGEPAMVTLISSYLFGDEPVHLNDLYCRKEDKTKEFWTNPDIAGKKFKKDVYILTSHNTFSGAEEFCYNLKHLKRATIVGQTTRGGAHPCYTCRLCEHFVASIPEKRAINPITKTNWEGTGVDPDFKVPENQALKTAYVMALTKSLETIQEEDFKEAKKHFIKVAESESDDINLLIKL